MKYKTMLFLLCMAISGSAQNLQIHYDYGEDRNFFTTTLEMFKADKLGSTFWFVDMDYDNPGNKSMSLAYWEIARYVTLPIGNQKISATIQYNDGVAPWGPLHSAWLFGLSYPIDLGIITLNTDILYRQMYTSTAPDFQLTLVWFKTFGKGKFDFMGYLDIWTQDIEQEKKWVIQAEPQIWYHLNPFLAMGSELEISKNFLPFDEVKYMPTLALKWIF
ncbi:DUF5020 family protein [candidate division KSB1 bacterium]|nr:DUF5020 family protein [candidate division KSB1 bacterium]